MSTVLNKKNQQELLVFLCYSIERLGSWMAYNLSALALDAFQLLSSV